MKHFIQKSAGLVLVIAGLIGCQNAIAPEETTSSTQTTTEQVSAEQADTQAGDAVTDNQSSEESLIVIAYLKVKPENRQEFLDLATETAKTTNEVEPGARVYTFYEDQNIQNLFFFYEEWDNQAAFEAHLEQPHTQKLTAKYADILAESADVRIYTIDGVETVQVP
ncbi:MAG: putative quinol monooxygenase [Microcoleaceae cyanobacterium]